MNRKKKRSVQKNQNKTQPSTQKIEVTTHTEISGPLPMADELARYEQVNPGTANRIIKQFEERSAHSMTLENSKVKTINFLLISG